MSLVTKNIKYLNYKNVFMIHFIRNVSSEFYDDKRDKILNLQ